MACLDGHLASFGQLQPLHGCLHGPGTFPESECIKYICGGMHSKVGLLESNTAREYVVVTQSHATPTLAALARGKAPLGAGAGG